MVEAQAMQVRPSKKTHPKEYAAWQAMRHRCKSKKPGLYEYYAGRGINVCPEWQESFATFFAEVGEAPTKTHSLDRIDNDRGYEPGNCRWATKTQQSANRRPRKPITFQGQTKTQSEWIEYLGIPKSTFRDRLKKWGICEKTFTKGKIERTGDHELKAGIHFWCSEKMAEKIRVFTESSGITTSQCCRAALSAYLQESS